ncbi:MAG TPA: hypothetical protein VGT82_07000 [Ktedonobacteraceae bacterium]|nr:hypothetical protein [Ktedonobacteraceae bacterium]
MKKFFFIGGGSLLLLLAMLCGMFFASPLMASAHSVATPATTTTHTAKTHNGKAKEEHPLRAFTRNHSDEIVDQIAPQLHLTSAQLTQKLRSGERLDKIAKDQKVSTANLKKIIVTSIDTVVSKELSAGKIDQAHATLLKTLVQKHPLAVGGALHHHYMKKQASK